MKLLMVEDDEMIGTALQTRLQMSGYVVDWAKDAQEALYGISVNEYEIVLLDIGLPDMSGFEVLKNIRENKLTVPVLILTAKDAMSDKIYGLDSGADDYMTKPFDPDELLARLRSLIRRNHNRTSKMLEHNGLVLDPETFEVSVDNKTQKLSSKEFVVLKTLMESIGVPFTIEKLEEILYSWDTQAAQSNTIEVFIYSLRKKLGTKWIKNIRGLGYFIPKVV